VELPVTENKAHLCVIGANGLKKSKTLSKIGDHGQKRRCCGCIVSAIVV
jgi:hypothetical protein